VKWHVKAKRGIIVAWRHQLRKACAKYENGAAAKQAKKKKKKKKKKKHRK